MFWPRERLLERLTIAMMPKVFAKRNSTRSYIPAWQYVVQHMRPVIDILKYERSYAVEGDH